jgi:hypothetical protein
LGALLNNLSDDTIDAFTKSAVEGLRELKDEFSTLTGAKWYSIKSKKEATYNGIGSVPRLNVSMIKAYITDRLTPAFRVISMLSAAANKSDFYNKQKHALNYVLMTAALREDLTEDNLEKVAKRLIKAGSKVSELLKSFVNEPNAVENAILSIMFS